MVTSSPFAVGAAFVSSFRKIPSSLVLPRPSRPPAWSSGSSSLRRNTMMTMAMATTRKMQSTRDTSRSKKQGDITIMNEQTSLPSLSQSIPYFTDCVTHIRSILGYPHYDVVLVLVDDDEIQELNRDYLGLDRPTDILSFPFDQDVIVEPGVLGPPVFDLPDYEALGDMMISVPYVMRRMQEDLLWLEEQPPKNTNDKDKDKDDDDDTQEEDRGVSALMATMDTVEQRIPALLVHGMCHLVGYDHIDDDDYDLMVTKEEQVWHDLQQRLKKDKETY